MAKNKRKTTYITDIAILIIAAIIIGISMLWSRNIELAIGLLYKADPATVSPDDVVDISSFNGAAYADELYPQLSVYFVDVGQGDCTIIELPDGKTMIIDAGKDDAQTERKIQAFIDDTLPTDFKYFDYAILTHADADHCGSLDYVLEKYPSRVCYRPNVEAAGTGYTDAGKADLSANATSKDTAAYRNSITAMYQTTDDFTSVVYVTNPAVDEQTITGGTGDDEYSLTFYSPLSEKYSDSNDYSPIMVLEYRGFKFAMSGDAEKTNEREFVQKVVDARTDGVLDKYDVFTVDYCVNVLKAGHHGSYTSTSQDYLDIMTTTEGAKSAYYIISCGLNNQYGHPHEETLTRLANMGVPDENILRTDMLGTITITVRMDEDGEYRLFYGDEISDTQPTEPTQPIEPTDPSEPSQPSEPTNPSGDTDVEFVYVYREVMGIKLKWPIVAWVFYGLLAVAMLANMAVAARGNGKRK